MTNEPRPLTAAQRYPHSYRLGQLEVLTANLLGILDRFAPDLDDIDQATVTAARALLADMNQAKAAA